MEILYAGLHGPFKGRIDNTVYYMLGDKNVSRQIGENNKPPSELQLRKRLATKLSGKFFCDVKAFIETGFGYTLPGKQIVKQPGRTPLNKCCCWLIFL